MRFVDVADETGVMKEDVPGYECEGHDGRLAPTTRGGDSYFVLRSVDQIEDFPVHFWGEREGESVWEKSLSCHLRVEGTVC